MLAIIPLLSFLVAPTLALAPLKVQVGNQEVFSSPPPDAEHENIFHKEPKRVPVLLGVMSKCPDAIFCEGFFDQVLKEVGHDKVDLGLSFIGKFEPQGITCMHGPSECAGNIHELCAIHRYDQFSSSRSESQEQWWNFVQCLNKTPALIGNVVAAARCAESVGIDWGAPGGMGQCVDTGLGESLLELSVKRSQEMGIRSSCSMFVSGELRCVHDSDWKRCNMGHEVQDFVDLIESEYQRINGLGGEDDWVLV